MAESYSPVILESAQTWRDFSEIISASVDASRARILNHWTDCQRVMAVAIPRRASAGKALAPCVAGRVEHSVLLVSLLFPSWKQEIFFKTKKPRKDFLGMRRFGEKELSRKI